jgi:hypothetical protein
MFLLLISIQFVVFWYTNFYTVLYFVNHRSYKTLAKQAHDLTHLHYFCSLNVINFTSSSVGKDWVISICAFTSQSSPASHIYLWWSVKLRVILHSLYRKRCVFCLWCTRLVE